MVVVGGGKSNGENPRNRRGVYRASRDRVTYARFHRSARAERDNYRRGWGHGAGGGGASVAKTEQIRHTFRTDGREDARAFYGRRGNMPARPIPSDYHNIFRCPYTYRGVWRRKLRPGKRIVIAVAWTETCDIRPARCSVDLCRVLSSERSCLQSARHRQRCDEWPSDGKATRNRP